ncbi:MAG: DUF4214 domain-containing protein [Pyrinomonadaceae bacterium]
MQSEITVARIRLVGDKFDVDYVAHEIVHDGNHTFNAGAANTGSCTAANRNAATAYEPGSGSTLASYAGICEVADLTEKSDDYFHLANLNEVLTYMAGIQSCTGTLTGALGRQPKLSEFNSDAQVVGNGIVVNGQLSGVKIEQNKADFAAQFVNCTDATKSRCAEFKAIYDGLNNQAYVDKLFLTTGVNASASDRTALVIGLNDGTETRASVLQKIVDGINVISEGNQQFTTTYGQAFYNAELNRAFVQLEYFGYMKRDPDDAGYAFWLGKLNQFGGNFVNAEMVLAFISSPEYRARFGQP